MMISAIRGLLLLLTANFLMVATAYADLRLGVLANRGELEATARWNGFADYLTEALGEKVVLVPLHPSKVAAAAKGGEVDMLFSHSPHTVLATEVIGGTLLATLNTPAGSRFGGVIVARRDSGIKVAADLRGKKVMSLKFKAAAGAYIFQAYHLLTQGIDPHADFASLREGKKQDDLVLAVRNGFIDAAFVRTGLLEAMAKEGKIKIEDFQIVDQRQEAGFPFLLSTALYPEWGFTALPSIPVARHQVLQDALMKITPKMTIAQKGRMVGFVEPQPLDGMRAALQRLQITPYQP